MDNKRSIESLIDEVRQREQDELRTAVINYGEIVLDGYEFHFEDGPIISAYWSDAPCDVVILSVKVKKSGAIKILADEKLDRGNPVMLEPCDIFPGEMRYITYDIVINKNNGLNT